MPPGQQCRAAIDRAERAYHLPPRLLAAIGRVESGRLTPNGIDPWPYSINVDGVDTVYETKAAAIAGVRALQASGVRSIDVGCMQINLMYHPDAFASLEEAFDPWRNADYGARFLVQLQAQSGSWSTATANYHSATPGLGGPYAAKVGTALAQEVNRPQSTMQLSGASPAAGQIAGFRAGGPPRAAAFGRPGLAMPPPSGRLRMNVASGQGLAEYRTHPVPMAAIRFPAAPLLR